MRAIIKCTTNVEPEGLDAFLIDRDWWPALSQDHVEVKARQNDILSHVAEEDRVIVENTIQYTIYDEATKSWGIVNKPTKHGVTFRIKNPDSDRLKSACEKLVRDLQGTGDRRRRDGAINFKFTSKIEVLEPNSTNHAYSGEILPANRASLAIRNRQAEFTVGLLAGLAALLLMIATLPGAVALFAGSLSPEMQVWTKGFMERLATSAIVTATVSLLNVFLYWIDMRRKSIIKWSLD